MREPRQTRRPDRRTRSAGRPAPAGGARAGSAPRAGAPGGPARSGPTRQRQRPARGRPGAPPRPTAQGHSLAFTSRAALLGLTLCAVVLMLAYPTKQYLGQRSAISAAQHERASLQAEISALSAEHAAASTPAQIEAQARAQLHYTLPGTRNYIQLSPPAPPARTATRAGHTTVTVDPNGTWFGSIWSSDVSAGR